MKHLDTDVLWGLARGQLSPADAQAARAHLDTCLTCSAGLDDALTATRALSLLPEAPPMPDAVARRVGERLTELADEAAAKRFAPWWQGLFTLRLALLATAAVVLLAGGAWLASARGGDVAPLPATGPLVAEPSTPALAPQPAPIEPPREAPKKLTAVVASARRSNATKRQVLEEGATVSTASGGSAWLKLPDGSRAGLTGTSEVTLARLDTQTLALELTRGNVALEVPHREDRLFVVRAGEVEVKDLGTRFLVSRQPERTLVAVEEGVVEVTTPEGVRELRAGRAATWKQGQLQEFAWEVPAPMPAPPRPVAPATPDVGAAGQAPHPPSVARLADEDDDDLPPPPDESDVAPAPAAPATATPPPDRTPLVADEQWAGLPTTPVPAVAPRPGLMPPPPKRRSGFSLRELERRLLALGESLAPNVETEREARARAIARAADVGDCPHAIALANRWLASPPTSLPTEPQLRRGVQLQKLRCLNHLGRVEEARALQRELETAH